MRKYIISIAVLLLFAASCKQLGTNPPDSTTGSIKTGDDVSIGTQSVGTGGGVLTISAPGKPVDGMKITVPSKSYPAARDFTISYAPVTSHSFGEFFKPVSPLITISNGGGYSDSLMLVKIPVTLEAGELPFAFFYNDAKGILEPIPMVSHDGSSITIMTRHFDVSGIAAGVSHSKFSPNAIPNFSKIIVSGLTDVMYNNLVGKLSSVSSGFLPGVDDWEFQNNGSYLAGAQGGHCAGQDLSSLWYFYERKSTEGKLHHHFDRIDVSATQLWEDNPVGYHLASAVQSKLNWETYQFELYQGFLGSQDEWVWKDLILTMAISKEPMTMGIYGKYQGKSVGHNVTAYAVDIANKKIRIADPNYPGDLTREIKYNNGTFVPYFSGPTAAESDYSFDVIYLNGKTAVIDWPTIAQTWTDVVDNKQNPGYPAYSLVVNEQSGYPLTDGMKTDLDTLDFSPQWSVGTGIAMRVFDASGIQIGPSPNPTYSLIFRDTIILKPGDNTFGVAIFGNTPNNGYAYVDFQWITVTYQALRIDPQTMTGQPNVAYNWNALVGTAPSNARYEWNFGDQTTKVVKYNDGSVSHTFSQAGDYPITLSLYDNAKNLLVGTATADAKIGAASAIWDILHKQNAIVVEWQSSRRYSDGTTSNSENWHIPESGDWLPITWNNTSLSGTFTKINPNGIDTTIYKVTGTLSADGLTVTSLTVSERTMTIVNSIDGYLLDSWERIIRYTISNIRGIDESVYNQPPYFQAAYDAVQPLISNPYSHYRHISYDPNTKQTTTVDRDFVSTDWAGGGDNLVAVAFWVH